MHNSVMLFFKYKFSFANNKCLSGNWVQNELLLDELLIRIIIVDIITIIEHF